MLVFLLPFQPIFRWLTFEAPTAFSNGPTCVEIQGDFITEAIALMRAKDVKYIDATKEAAEEWRQKVTDLNDETLFPGTSSWYNGGNVPGKPREQLNYLGGIPKYDQELRGHLDGLKGFVLVK